MRRFIGPSLLVLLVLLNVLFVWASVSVITNCHARRCDHGQPVYMDDHCICAEVPR